MLNRTLDVPVIFLAGLCWLWLAMRVLTSSPTLALRVTGGGFPLLGDSCSRSTGFLLHRAA